jgi:hypothetical protein
MQIILKRDARLNEWATDPGNHADQLSALVCDRYTSHSYCDLNYVTIVQNIPYAVPAASFGYCMAIECQRAYLAGRGYGQRLGAGS